MPRGNAKLHLVHGKGGQVFKIIDLTFANSAHFLVDHTQGPQSETLTGDQRDAGIEAQTELTGNEGLASTRGYIWDRAGISKSSSPCRPCCSIRSILTWWRSPPLSASRWVAA